MDRLPGLYPGPIMGEELLTTAPNNPSPPMHWDPFGGNLKKSVETSGITEIKEITEITVKKVKQSNHIIYHLK